MHAKDMEIAGLKQTTDNLCKICVDTVMEQNLSPGVI